MTRIVEGVLPSIGGRSPLRVLTRGAIAACALAVPLAIRAQIPDAEFVLIHAGTFQMGDTGTPPQGTSPATPVHTVTLTHAFYLQRTLVTQTEWQAVMGNNPSSHVGCPACPVDSVSFEDVRKFIATLSRRFPGKGFRLPTEAEWEYAARAGTTGDFSTPGPPALSAWVSSNSKGMTHDVGRLQPNPWGLFDMAGDVGEWVGDFDGPYSARPATDPLGPGTGNGHVTRGGDFDHAASYARTWVRVRRSPGFSSGRIGFRLVRAVPEEGSPPRNLPQPAAQPIAQAAAQPPAEPVAKPATPPAAEAVAPPATQPVVRPTSQPAALPTSHSAAPIAVAMHTGVESSPFTVEIRDGAWIEITFISRENGTRAPPVPSGRLIVTADEVREWSARVHEELAAPDTRASGPRSPPLGKGREQLQWLGGSAQAERGTPRIRERLCGGGFNGSAMQGRPDDVARAVALLDAAAALVGESAAPQPSSTRAYLSSEVSCPPSPDPMNPAPQFPTRVPPAEQRPTEIGVRFIVDQYGEVEDGSLDFLPGTDPRLADAARPVIAHWRFQPAEWDGTPVRGLVQTSVAFDAFEETGHTPARTSNLRPVIHADSDGWVRVLLPVPTGWAHEWYAPDEIDSWESRVRTLSKEVADFNSHDRSTTFRPQMDRVDLGHPGGIRYSFIALAVPAGATRADNPARERGPALTVRNVTVSSNTFDCAGGGSSWGADSLNLDAFTAAASSARAARPRPVDPAASVHAANDVACPAWLPPRRIVGGIPVQQAAPYPSSLAATNARAEVLASFVVDAIGRVDPTTLRVMAESNPAATAALTAWLPSQHFSPATRDGIHVPQVVMQTFLFEPPVRCRDPKAAPECWGAGDASPAPPV